MATVYLARLRQEYSGTSPVALKVAADSNGCNDVLKGEADLLQKLDHAHILKIVPIPVGTIATDHHTYVAKAEPANPQSPWYIAVEYVPGGSIEQLLKICGPLSCDGAVEITTQIAKALTYLHNQGVVHLDVKPANILLRRPPASLRHHVPQAVLVDFGVAWSSKRPYMSSVYGAPAYMAPERAAGAPAAPQQDIFSLGVVLYEMVTGHTPFDQAATSQAEIAKDRRPTAMNPAVPESLEKLILRAIATDPQQRYQSMQQLVRDLDLLPEIKQPGTIKRPLLRGRSPNQLALFGLSLIILLMLASLLIGYAAGPLLSPPAGSATPYTTSTPPPTHTPAATPTTVAPTRAATPPSLQPSTSLPASTSTAAPTITPIPLSTATAGP
ncbi:MAG: serine/threonine protein kinase [Chloroflexales bacterium]|nr:serine/threonine protein kinase [Chloroflexales bacterium]